ncbi:hypothetical protein [Streptomyces sp. NRRL F-5135]|uniref:hypothetical protein n=1 Tax=Streptomyces sp. NRRL F-5135 TaxID=1463858 RepID=UPI00055DAF1F|nr:hypothetical protein [Streptomyces sp. NRRL F-5135]
MTGLAAFGVLAAGLLLSGCSTGGTGTRDEGAAVHVPAVQGAPTPTTSASAPARTVEPVSLLRKDPKVNARIKADLKPCAGDAYPLDTSYGNLTGSAAADVVINVMTCEDSVGIATYVYRAKDGDAGGGYENVFAAEEPAVYATIDRGELVVTQQIYAGDDSVSYPSGEEVITYSWAGSAFNERFRVRNSYSKAVGKGGMEVPAVPAVPASPVPAPDD